MALTNKSNFIIGSTEFVPKSLKPSYESLQKSNSGRTDDGVMHIYWARRKVRKLEIEMPPMTPAEAYAILSLVQGQEYNITFWDLTTNSEQTFAAYTSNSSADWYSGVVHNGLIEGLSFNAIEK